MQTGGHTTSNREMKKRSSKNLVGLDDVPWSQLSHAYGTAEDVVDLLKLIDSGKSFPNASEESPIDCLYGNIWHQGTVYEATSYAVPFLLNLAEDSQIPNAEEIVTLLGMIACGESGQEPWADRAHAAVLAGYDRLAALIYNEKTKLAAAFVLAQLHERSAEFVLLLTQLQQSEASVSRRAGLILLYGHLGDRSTETLAVLEAALTGAKTPVKQAIAVSLAKLKFRDLSAAARKAILATIKKPHEFRDLPWGDECAVTETMLDLKACLSEAEIERVIKPLLARIESGESDSTSIQTVLDLLFQFSWSASDTVRVTFDTVTPLQRRAIEVITAAQEVAIKSGDRIFVGSFSQWGLPETMREWRRLAAGLPPQPIDLTLPLFGQPENPAREILPDDFRRDLRVHHRNLGLGTVIDVQTASDSIRCDVLFDEEGAIKRSFSLTPRNPS